MYQSLQITNCKHFRHVLMSTPGGCMTHYECYIVKFYDVLIGAILLCYPIYISTKRSFNSVGTQKIIYYQSINLATCSGSLSHRQANSQTPLKAHSVDVHTVGSHKVYRSYDNESYKLCFFIIAPCSLIFTQFIHQQMHIY